MTTLWIAVALVALITVLLRGAGALLLGDRALPARVLVVFAYLPAPLLASLVVVETLSTGRHLIIDARLAGLAVAALAVMLRANLAVVIVLAALTTALARLIA